MKKQAEGSAPAKINLFLDVSGKRDDGYHNLTTVFIPVPGLCDHIRISTTDSAGIAIACDADGVPCDHRNLVWQAAAKFADVVEVEPHWHIVLDKKIPIAAGLGGGSSDAATVLLLLNDMHDKLLSQNELHHIAADLGADVPYFLNPRPAVGKGRGDVLQPISCNLELPLVLVNPGFPIRASWAYAHLPSTWQHPGLEALTDAIIRGDLRSMADNSFNVFEYAAFRKFPLLEMLVNDMQKNQECLAVRMSGSGPTLYAIMNSNKAARNLGERIKQEFGSKIWVCASLKG
ncbi:MAG: 4-(cytidine 5'-diphospho)-2-C-methyl-D-erythritol kinase [Lentisphaeria bacterium]